MSAAIILEQMTVIFLLILVGYVLVRKNVIQPDLRKGLSALVVNVCNPALIISSSFSTDPSITNDKVLMAAMWLGVLYIILIIGGKVIPMLLRVSKKEKSIYTLMSLFGNNGFIGIPLVTAVIGEHALIYIAIANIYFSLLVYTYGMKLVDDLGEKNTEEKFQWKKLINIGNISCVAAVLLFFFRPQLPAVITETVNYAGQATTVLAMFVIGISISQTALSKIFREVRLYPFIILRFVVLPIVVSLILRIFIKDSVMYETIVVMAMVPVANMPLMMAEEKGIQADLLSRGIILSTVASLITIPFVTLFI